MLTDPRFASGFQHSVHILVYYTVTQAASRVMRDHGNAHVRNVGTGEAALW